MSREYSDEEVKAEIIWRLLRRGCWGGRYMPRQTLVRWISKKVKRNGRRVERLVNRLVREGLILVHKGGEALSLNPVFKREVIMYVERIVSER
jgi:hypothetical protein